MTLTHDEYRSLLGASALNALPPDEVELLDGHLAGCVECREELRDLQSTTSLLVEPDADPPPGLWDDIVSSIHRGPEDMPQSLRRVVRKRSNWRHGWALAALGAAAAVIVLAVSVANLNGDVNRLQNQATSNPLQKAADNALTSSGHRLVNLRSPSGTELAQAVITTDGDAFLLPKTLTALGSGRTYQLWAESRGVAVSLGVLGSRPGISAFRVESGMTALMLTAEPAGGVSAPDSSVLAFGGVPSSA